MKKLRYVDELMREICDQKPLVRSREHVDPVRELRKTLATHYQEKHDRYEIGTDTSYDHALRKVFSSDQEHASQPTAASFLRRYRVELRKVVSQGTGQYLYTIDQVLAEMMERCRELKLRLTQSEEATKQAALVMLTAQTMNYLQAGHDKVVL